MAVEAAALSTMWDSVLCLVTEGVDFELLPLPIHHSPIQQTIIDCQQSYDEPDFYPQAAGGPPDPHMFDECNLVIQEDLYQDTDYVDGEPIASIPHQSDSTTPVDDSFFDAPPILTAGGPPAPGPPPPPPPMATVTPHVQALQTVTQLVMRIKGAMDSKDLKKGTQNTDSDSLDYDALNDEGKKWADFSARGHKLKDGEEFIALANEERKKIEEELMKLSDESRVDASLSLSDVKSAAEILGAAGDWYQGGIKELKEGNPKYKELEKTIDTVQEFVQVSKEMTNLVPEHRNDDGDLQELLDHTRKEFDKKHKRWGSIILTGAECWKELKLPVCDRLLSKSHQYLCGLVVRFVQSCLVEARKVDKMKEYPRTKQAKERLEESIKFLQEAGPYFSLKQSSEDTKCSCGECPSEVSSQNGLCPDTFLTPHLLKLTVDIAQAYFDIGLGQFEGYVYKHEKQRIHSHFQSILDFLKKVEELVSQLPRDEVDSSQMKTVGVVSLLPEADGLKSTMEQSCEVLCTHVNGEARLYKELPSEEDNTKKQEMTKEIVSWMTFTSKYNYQMLTAIGRQLTNQQEGDRTTVQIAHSFIEDNLKQYDNFVHVLDRKRIHAHFACIKTVVVSLASNSTSDKTIVVLPNGDVLAESVVKSCEKLVEHYKSHAKNEVDLLQADVSEDSHKKRKKEASQWLVFGGEYFCEMLKALGPDFTDRVMKYFTEFEEVSERVEKFIKDT